MFFQVVIKSRAPKGMAYLTTAQVFGCTGETH
jgi:hypothetical protein